MPLLGTIGNNSTPPLFHGENAAYRENVLRRFVRQQTARKHSDSDDLANCLRATVPGTETVNVHGGEGRSYFANLQTCNRVWICPVCAPKITERRRRALTAGLERKLLYPVMLTATSAHTADTRLDQQFKAMALAWAKFTSGAPWQRFVAAYGVNSWARNAEVTVSVENGWHTHFHALLLLELPLGADDLELMQDHSKRRWVGAVDRAGLSASFEHGMTLVSGNDALARYIAKYGLECVEEMPGAEKRLKPLGDGWTIAHEITKSPVKAGRRDERGIVHYSPFELLDLIEGDDDDLATWARRSWHEYQAATKGHRQIVTSRNFPVKLDDPEPEPSEAEAEAEAEALALLAELPRSSWWALLRLQKKLKRLGLDVRALLLDVARMGDAEALAVWIADRLAEADVIKAENVAQREAYLGAIEKGVNGSHASVQSGQRKHTPGDKMLAKVLQLRRAGWVRIALPGEKDQTDHSDKSEVRT